MVVRMNEAPRAEAVVSGSPLKGGKESRNTVFVEPEPVPGSSREDRHWCSLAARETPLDLVSLIGCEASVMAAGNRERGRGRGRERIYAGTAEPLRVSPPEAVVSLNIIKGKCLANDRPERFT